MNKISILKVCLQPNEIFIIQELKISGINLIDLVTPIILKSGQRLIVTADQEQTILVEIEHDNQT